MPSRADNPGQSLSPLFVEQLGHILHNDNLLTDPADTWVYGYDNSRRQIPPSAVALPTTHQQVVDIVKLCNRFSVPITPRGRATGTPGGAVPVHHGVVLSCERMNRILHNAPEDRYMIVEPGVINATIQKKAQREGFFWAPDPTSAAFCTVGGNLAYNSAGPRAVKYGTPRENVLGLRAVTGAGEEICTGVRTSKGVVGYDLTRLIIGSEGTLAIITEATLKLIPQAETKRTLRAIYRDIQSAAAAVSRIMAQPVTPSALEFIDGNAINMIRNYTRAAIPEDAGALLMIEVDGIEAGIDAASTIITNAANGSGLVDLQTARSQQEITSLWAMRKALSPALRTVAPKKINEDVVVPVSRMAELVTGLDQLAKKHEITIINFGHAGNGNIHVNLLIDPTDQQQLLRAERCLDELFTLVLELDGTLSGEHGVGIDKREFVSREIESQTLALMKRVKKQFDPNGILNPGKMFP
ncbi:MAG TPA: FAD-binding protein [Gammaproteobacteria bacterium]|nr:FAD-binding protein [Gammaproteobacteria bacterium]